MADSTSDASQRTHLRTVRLQMAPQLMSRRLGSDLYTPAQALEQLVANALDAGCSRIDITLKQNTLGGVQEVSIADDGCGIEPNDVDQAFAIVGEHWAPRKGHRDVIGSKGIGRFAAFALAHSAVWTTVADSEGGRVRQSWVLTGERGEFEVESVPAPTEPTGTVVELQLKDREGVQRLVSGVRNVHRVLFNAFAGYLLRYRGEVALFVNDELLELSDFVESEQVEEIPEGDSPGATLRHIILGSRVDQEEANAVVFAAAGNTVLRRPVEEPAIEGKKYLGLVDSPYLQELTNTAKSDLAEFDDAFRSLEREALERARRFIRDARGDRAETFLAKARANAAYPFKELPQSVIQQYSRDVYDRLLVELDREFGIGAVSSKQLQLVLALVSQLLRSEDLADVITKVLGLRGEEVTRFADILRRTTLSSVIAVSELIVDRLAFLRDLEELVYGGIAQHVLERRHLQKIVEAHTWIFGEQYHLMGADSRLSTILREFANDIDQDSEAHLPVPDELRDVPDYYLAKSHWNEGARFTQHLVVEIKRPSVQVTTRHIDRQVERYAQRIVANAVFEQREDSHRFTFVIVSAQVAETVRTLRYQQGQEPGLIGRPVLPHQTEIWALRWSDLIARRREELAFLEKQVELSGDPQDLEYLRRTVGQHLPADVTAGTDRQGPGSAPLG
ncbi:MAG: hypothetical protein C0506_12055 [Anaerolinea sp.]|nr:hypothetical protein [Anaerolinea sp.]